MNKYNLFADTIKQSVSALDVGQALGWDIRHGRCKCPLHNGDGYNMKLYSGNRGYMCWVCKSAGDVISLVRNYYSDMSYKQCLQWFSDTFHLGLDLQSSISPEEKRRAEIALKMRKRAIEHEEWMKRMLFNLALIAEDIVRRLENVRDEKRPRTYGEWDEEFCTAVGLLPDARLFADDCMMDCMEVREC